MESDTVTACEHTWIYSAGSSQAPSLGFPHKHKLTAQSLGRHSRAKKTPGENSSGSIGVLTRLLFGYVVNRRRRVFFIGRNSSV